MSSYNKHKPSHRAALKEYLTRGGPSKGATELRNQLNKDPVSFEKQIEAKTKELSEDKITEKQRKPAVSALDYVEKKLPELMVVHDEVNPDDMIVRHDPALSSKGPIFINKKRDIMFADITQARLHNKVWEAHSPSVQNINRQLNNKTPSPKPGVAKAAASGDKKARDYILNKIKAKKTIPEFKLNSEPTYTRTEIKKFIEETPEQKSARLKFEKILEDNHKEKIKRANGGLAYLMGVQNIESNER